jgi:predicted DNA-binding protein (MmcQ/YjbR family)
VAAPKKSSGSPALLRQLATALPEVTEGITCDKAAYKAGGKSFLFVGSDGAATTIMLKLQASLPEAKKLTAARPATYKVGGTNWVTITLPHDQPPPINVLQRWIEESYRLLVPRKLTATLDGAKPLAVKAKTSSKPTASRRRP